MLFVSLVLLTAAIKALLSPEGSIDSGLLAIIFIGVAILPFGLAMVAIGYSRARLAQLYSETWRLLR